MNNPFESLSMAALPSRSIERCRDTVGSCESPRTSIRHRRRNQVDGYENFSRKDAKETGQRWIELFASLRDSVFRLWFSPVRHFSAPKLSAFFFVRPFSCGSCLSWSLPSVIRGRAIRGCAFFVKDSARKQKRSCAAKRRNVRLQTRTNE
jgi:hypothetical protein